MGKGGEKSDKTQTKEVLIEGRFYDVTNLKHPGGSVINLYAGKGIDATNAFNQFHIRALGKTKKYLDGLTSRPADVSKEIKPNLLDDKQDKLMADFDEFSKQLEKEGYFKPDYFHATYRITEILVLYSIGIWLTLNSYFVPGIVFMAIAQGRCGWCMHEGGHYSLYGNVAVDKFLQEVIYGVGCGMSGGWWRIQHNKHHSMPQKLGADVDLNTLPLVAFTEKVVKRASSALKGWIRLQAVLFPLISTSLVALMWQIYLHPRHILRTKNWVEAGSLVVRYILWTYFFTMKFGVAQSALIYLAYDWVSANYIFLHFALSHTHLGVVPSEDTKVDWIRYASVYTMNIKPGPFGIVNWIMGYLNFQIEHHLFPCMPQFKFAIISPRVKKFFEDHGLVYDQREYFDAYKVTFQNLDKVGAEVYLG